MLDWKLEALAQIIGWIVTGIILFFLVYGTVWAGIKLVEWLL